MPYDQLAPQFQTVAQRQLEQRGVRKPNRPDVVYAYQLWVAAQPPGSDTSPETYVAWLVDYEKKQKAAA